MVVTHTHVNIKAKGQSVRKIEWKQTEATALPPVLMQSVITLNITEGHLKWYYSAMITAAVGLLALLQSQHFATFSQYYYLFLH